MQSVETGLVYGHRTWFIDDRSPVRRLGLSAHPDQGLVVLSLWQGDTCTATFRLPLTEANRLIAALADGMSAGLAASDPRGPRTSQPASRPKPWERALARLRRGWRPRSSTGGGPGLRLVP